MIAYVRGVLSTIQDESVIIDVNGIGYEVICPNPYRFQAHMDEEVFVHTYYYVREDAHILYGFQTNDEKHLFTKLISVSGIGPKSALGILSAVDVSAFVAAVEREDEKYLVQFPGIGKKTARQIILDLKGKLDSALSITAAKPEKLTEASYLDDALEALKALGFSDKEIKNIIPELQKEDKQNTDQLIRTALSLLQKT
ncbi:Holliday junction ATP-dependent DNA helicase RuvA [Compostibacillus humi]|uniref:Holliday junction branch migration complex subunit RuvA n=1 Tax=Compostibacillus humi TaxID=1245525 RepID=A0A8J2ZPD4_9BACI|nr:Holliday junction branch migration protein RuvA [Compostibacillus humi]GGH68573.1 Holliday junction ATP-dependent DNA helicase RuvA [Compostibacillus humi]